MSKEKHFFKDQRDCEAFFARVALNCGKEFTPTFVFEGNSGTTYQYIIDIAKIIGYKNIGVGTAKYANAELDFVDEIYIRLRGENPDNDTDNRVWIEAAEVSLEADGTLRIWWD
jgi:hypothetical protein